MALTEQETRLLLELLDLREAYENAGVHNTQDPLQMLQAALGLMYNKRKTIRPVPVATTLDTDDDSTSLPATQVVLIDERIRDVTVAIHLRIWDCLNRAETLSNQSDVWGSYQDYLAATKREKALFAYRLLNNIMIPGTYDANFLPDIQHALAHGAFVEGYADCLLAEAIEYEDLCAQLVYCRELLTLNEMKLPEEHEESNPRLANFYQWLNRHPHHRQALSVFQYKLDKALTTDEKQQLYTAFNHLFWSYNSAPMSKFFCTPGTSDIQRCLETHILPIIQAAREYSLAMSDKHLARRNVENRPPIAQSPRKIAYAVDRAQKPLFQFLSPNRDKRERPERPDDEAPSTITGKKCRAIEDEGPDAAISPQSHK